MENLEKALQGAQAIATDLKGLLVKNKQKAAALDQREKVLTEREANVVDRLAVVSVYEKIDEAWAEIRKVKTQLHDENNRLEQLRATLANQQKDINQKLATVQAESESLANVRDLAKQLKKDREALEQEKKKYKEQVLREVQEKFLKG